MKKEIVNGVRIHHLEVISLPKYDYAVSFEKAIKQGIPKEEYARESSKNVILTWIANELAELNRLKRLELSEKLGSFTQESNESSKSWKPDKELEDMA